jgi:hypothetical protein
MKKTTKTTTTEAKRQARKKATAEDFTPAWLVNQMLDKLKEYAPTILSDPTKTFLDPACGNGNMLVCILQHKLTNGVFILDALKTTFGCDIMRDNIRECQLRLFKVVAEYSKSHNIKISKSTALEILKILACNIVCTPLDKYPNGSLDYLSLSEDETFNRKITEEQASTTLDNIMKKKLLDAVTI